jgi:uncharacterized oligopeptide transporter (OPT) family protein
MKGEKKIDKKTWILIGLTIAFALFVMLAPELSIGILIGGVLYFIYTENPKLQKQIKELLKGGMKNNGRRTSKTGREKGKGRGDKRKGN